MSCPICGRIKANSPHHIIPESEGGGDNHENITYLCKKCHDEVEEDPKLWARFLRYYHFGSKVRMEKLKKDIRETRKRRLGTARKVRPKERKAEYIIPEGSPNWLAKKLGVHRCIVSSIAQKNWPRPRSEKWKPRRLNQEQVDLITTVVNEKKKWHEEVNLSRVPTGRLRSGGPRGPHYELGEESPGTFGEEIGIPGRMVRSALRVFFLRNEEKKWSKWGPLSEDMKDRVKSLVYEYKEVGGSWSRFLNSKVASQSK